ncbi:hypothetical protein SO802_035584 [Lithocarpus litseifolius]|uniref:Photosystem I iron-sulfur center n=1 Tax=Lithocarpus litseifolius TaxID=425828 RepID=A0AAW2BCM3_9ROSI
MNRGKTYEYASYKKGSHDSQYGPPPPVNAWCSRLVVTLDGEDVIDCEPILGYLHRGMEKIAENRTIIQYLPYVTRWDYLATMFTEAITVNGPERLGNIQVPKRASYIRVIMLELSRIASHLLWLGPFMADIGAQTPFFYIFRERELVYDLFEAATGPMLRASGIQWDLRKIDHYECYDEFDWEVQWQKEGDSLARYLVRIGEMAESIKIIQQALEGIPGGPYENLEIRYFDRKRVMDYGQQTVRVARYIGQSFMITLSHANRLPVTIQYPYEKLITSERFRGRIHFEFDKCIACEVCVRVCPMDLPVVDWELETNIRKKRLLNYSIDFGICIFCGCTQCVRACPTDVLEMIPWDGCKAKQIASAPRTEDCVGCKRCESACPTDFLSVRVYLWHETTRSMGLAY